MRKLCEQNVVKVFVAYEKTMDLKYVSIYETDR